MKYAHLNKQTGEEKFFVSKDQETGFPAVFERVEKIVGGIITTVAALVKIFEHRDVRGDNEATAEKAAEDHCDELNGVDVEKPSKKKK